MIARLEEPAVTDPIVVPVPLPVLQSRLLSAMPFVAHGITCRVPGLGFAEGNVGFGAPRDREDAWRMRLAWCDAIGLEAQNLVTVHQTHGDAVAVATLADAGRGGIPGSEPLANADAIITADRGVTLMTLHADCQPLLLCDPVVPVVAVVHAGWRGTVAGIASAVIRQLAANHSAVPHRTIAYLGPTNRGCCYQVGEEVATAWLHYDPSNAAGALRFMGDRWHFDVAAANRWTLLREGLLPQHIESSNVCTQCESDEWFSHRAQGPLTGRFGAVIGLR